jgi:hypothetical protein
MGASAEKVVRQKWCLLPATRCDSGLLDEAQRLDGARDRVAVGTAEHPNGADARLAAIARGSIRLVRRLSFVARWHERTTLIRLETTRRRFH